MNLSYWELQQFFNKTELVIAGSGIVGLNAAIQAKTKFPDKKIVILERGLLPSGASTKNAGFACFGSISELLSDLETSSEKTVWETVALRYKGLLKLRKLLGDKHIDYKNYGGHEIFDSEYEFGRCQAVISHFNVMAKDITGKKTTYLHNDTVIKKNGLKNILHNIENKEEGQIDTGLMMFNLLDLARRKGIIILNGIEVTKISDDTSGCKLLLNNSIEIKTKKVIIATNGFARQLLKKKDVQPARAQVLITNEIKGIKIKGAFHYQQGFYYFRNVGNRVLLGGGRNLDIKGEQTTEFGLTPRIQKQLEKMLSTIILPGSDYKIEHRWSGIMGVGNEKKPIIEHISPNVVCAVRMGGMGVAIGSLVGEMAAKKIFQ